MCLYCQSTFLDTRSIQYILGVFHFKKYIPGLFTDYWWTIFVLPCMRNAFQRPPEALHRSVAASLQPGVQSQAVWLPAAHNWPSVIWVMGGSGRGGLYLAHRALVTPCGGPGFSRLASGKCGLLVMQQWDKIVITRKMGGKNYNKQTQCGECTSLWSKQIIHQFPSDPQPLWMLRIGSLS